MKKKQTLDDKLKFIEAVKLLGESKTPEEVKKITELSNEEIEEAIMISNLEELRKKTKSIDKVIAVRILLKSGVLPVKKIAKALKVKLYFVEAAKAIMEMKGGD